MSPSWCLEKSWKSRGGPGRTPNSERGQAAWQAGSAGQVPARKSRGDSLHPAGFGKGSESSGLSRAGPPPRSLSPGRRTESTWRSQKEISPPGPVRGAERQWVKPGEPLHLRGPGKPSECGWQSLQEKMPPSHPGKGTGSDWKGQGKPLRPVSPTRPVERDWRGRGDAHQAQVWEKDWKRQGKPVCRADLMHQMEINWKSPVKCLDVGLRPDDSWKRPPSPAQRLEDDWKGPEHTRDTNNPEKPLESDWENKRLLIYHVSTAGARADGDPARCKTGKHGVGGSPGLQFCAPWLPRSLCFSRGATHREVDARIWETMVRTKPTWLQLLRPVPAAPAEWRCVPTAEQRRLLGKPTATLECQREAQEGRGQALGVVRKGGCPSPEVTTGSTWVSCARSEWAQRGAAFL